MTADPKNTNRSISNQLHLPKSTTPSPEQLPPLLSLHQVDARVLAQGSPQHTTGPPLLPQRARESGANDQPQEPSHRTLFLAPHHFLLHQPPTPTTRRPHTFLATAAPTRTSPRTHPSNLPSTPLPRQLPSCPRPLPLLDEANYWQERQPNRQQGKGPFSRPTRTRAKEATTTTAPTTTETTENLVY